MKAPQHPYLMFDVKAPQGISYDMRRFFQIRAKKNFYIESDHLDEPLLVSEGTVGGYIYTGVPPTRAPDDPGGSTNIRRWG